MTRPRYNPDAAVDDADDLRARLATAAALAAQLREAHGDTPMCRCSDCGAPLCEDATCERHTPACRWVALAAVLAP